MCSQHKNRGAYAAGRTAPPAGAAQGAARRRRRPAVTPLVRPPPCPLPCPQVGDALVKKLKFGFTQEKDDEYLRRVDMAADEDDSIPMPDTAGKPVTCVGAGGVAAGNPSWPANWGALAASGQRASG